VADDLEAIIPAASGPSPHLFRLRGREPGRRPGVRSTGRAARLGALAAAACVGLSAGALLPRIHSTARPTASPGAPANLHIVHATIAEPGPLEPARLISTLPPAERAAPPPKAKAAPAVRPSRRAPAPACASERRCSYATVMAADARLRRAYEHAIRAGVSRTVLVDYRDEWSDLRRDARHRPGRTTAGYRRLASELDELARTHHTVAYRPRRAHGLGRLGQELASLFP
jgi:hypothetical protein